MPDEKPAESQKPHVGPGAQFFNLKNVSKLPPEERRKVFERIREAINKELHRQDSDAADEKKEEPPE